MVGAAKFKIGKRLQDVIHFTGLLTLLTVQVKKFTSVGRPEICFKINLVFNGILCLEPKTCINIGSKDFSVQRLKVYEQLVYIIRLVIDFLKRNSGFIRAVTLGDHPSGKCQQ